jgi:hypothetical protein
LCWQLGVPHPDHLGELLTARQWHEWIAWLTLRPRGENRSDAWNALLVSVVNNRWRSKKEEALTPEKLIRLIDGVSEPPKTAEQLEQTLRIFAAKYGHRSKPQRFIESPDT